MEMLESLTGYRSLLNTHFDRAIHKGHEVPLSKGQGSWDVPPYT